jgi:hypothetical protein
VVDKRSHRIDRGGMRADEAAEIRPTRRQEQVDVIGPVDIAGGRGRNAELVADAFDEGAEPRRPCAHRRRAHASPPCFAAVDTGCPSRDVTSSMKFQA